MGMITESVLNLCGFQIYRIDEEAEVEATVDAACSMAFHAAISRLRSCCRSAWSIASNKPGPLTVDRRKFVAQLLEKRGGLLVVTGHRLARPRRRGLRRRCAQFLHLERAWLHAVGGPGSCAGAPRPQRRRDHRRRRRADGARLARDHRHQAAEKSFDRLSRQRPLQRHRMQPSATSAGIDLAAAAAACRLRVESADDLSRAAELRALLHAGEGPLFIHARVDADDQKRINPSRDGRRSSSASCRRCGGRG